MYSIWELLAGLGASEGFHKVVETLIKSGKNPQKEAAEKIFSDHPALREKEYDDIKMATIKALDSCVQEDVNLNIEYLTEVTKQKFEYLSHTPNSQEIKKIELACREIYQKFSIALKTIAEDPSYEILKILLEPLLPTIEDILEKDNKIDPELFRETPLWVDFEKGFFVKREKQIEKVLQDLENHNVHLICGPPASGKSNFVKYLGYELARNYCVFYIGLKEHNLASFSKEILRIVNRNEFVLIIDDAHLNLKIVQNLIDIMQNKNLKFIVSTRPLSSISYRTHISSRMLEYIKDEKCSTFLDPEEILNDLIDKYVEIHKMKIDSKSFLEIKKKYKKDLWILYWALKTLAGKGNISNKYIFEKVAEERFRKYQHDLDKSVDYVGKILYYVSIFSRYEFPVEKKFIFEKTDEKKLEILLKSREFVELEKNRIMLYHSSIAKIYLETFFSGAYAEFFPEKDREADIFRDYIREYPERGVEFIGTISSFQYGKYRLIKRLLSKIGIKNVGKAIDRSDNMWRIGNCVSSIFKADNDAGKSLIENVGKAIDRSDDYFGIGNCVSSILKADNDAGKSLIENVGKAIDRSDDLEGIIKCVYCVMKADKDAGKSLLGNVGKAIDRSDDYFGIGLCIYSILEADKDAGKSLLGNVGKAIDRSDDLEGIIKCVYCVMKADNDAGKSLIENVGKAIDRSDDYFGIGLCIYSILKADNDAGKSLLGNVGKAIDRSDDLEGIIKCVYCVMKADKDAGKELITLIKRKDIDFSKLV